MDEHHQKYCPVTTEDINIAEKIIRPDVSRFLDHKSDPDVVRQITVEAQNIHKLKRTYIKGHQDLAKDKMKHTLPETYNIQADHLDTVMHHTMSGPAHEVIVFPASRVNVYLLGQHISSFLDRFLHASYTRARFWKYVDQKFG